MTPCSAPPASVSCRVAGVPAISPRYIPGHSCAGAAIAGLRSATSCRVQRRQVDAAASAVCRAHLLRAHVSTCNGRSIQADAIRGKTNGSRALVPGAGTLRAQPVQLFPELDLQPALDRFVVHPLAHRVGKSGRSEEHTSELQSLMRISYAVFCLKKK